LVAYFFYYRQQLSDPAQRFVIRYAVLSLILTVFLVFVFPGSYVIYSRGYVAACIFQGFAASLIFQARRGWVHNLVFSASSIVAVIFYTRLLTFYADEYLPYRSVLTLSE
jgi:hypothetical protein